MTTASVVSPGGTPLVGAAAGPRAMGVLATAAHAFAQVLSRIDAADDATEGTGEGGGPAANSFEAWRPKGVTDAHATPPEAAVPIEVVRSLDPWTTLTPAWAATSDVDGVAGVDEPDEIPATDQSQMALQVVEPAVTTVEPMDAAPPDVALRAPMPVVIDTSGPADVTTADTAQPMSPEVAPGRTAQAHEPRSVRTPPVPDAAHVASAPPSDASPADTAQASTADTAQASTVAKTPGPPTTWTPSNERPPSSAEASAPGWHERHERADEARGQAPPSAGSGAAAEVPSTAAALSDTPVAATPGREPERVPSLPEAPAAVAVQPSVRAASDVTPPTGIDAASPATPEAATAVVDQVVKSMRLQWKNGLGEARIQLRPEHLGPVDISIKVEGGSITAVVRAESSQVQDWILSHQQSLRQQLEAAGLRLDALVVSPDAERRRQGEQAEARQQAASRRRRHDGRAPVFEVIV